MFYFLDLDSGLRNIVLHKRTTHKNKVLLTRSEIKKKRKEDAMALAQLLYDIYKENGVNAKINRG